MTPEHFKNAIERAVEVKDHDVLEAIALRLTDAAEAAQILRAKGYGTSGMGLAALARLVPVNTNRSRE